MDASALLTGLVIFIARVGDVSLGTIRTIVIVQGKTTVAFLLGFVEVMIWIAVVSTVVHNITDQPILAFFYAGGFATGNVVGIVVERRLGFGSMILRVITRSRGRSMAYQLREMGQGVTVFEGEGKRGPVAELYIACRRRDLKWILPVVRSVDPEAFYFTEQVHEVSKALKPMMSQMASWGSALKKK
jgi:uncharacterized protein YebE (UPF0316 family)